MLANQDPANLHFANNPQPPPPPETLTWVGGGDNSVDDPGDWSPNAVPEAGDKLYMLDGTANIPGGNLAGDVLNVGYNAQGTNPATTVNPIINVSGGADVTIDVASPYGDANHTTINVADNDTLAMGEGGIAPTQTGPFESGDNNLAADQYRQRCHADRLGRHALRTNHYIAGDGALRSHHCCVLRGSDRSKSNPT